jgi:hypothetical protein
MMDEKNALQKPDNESKTELEDESLGSQPQTDDQTGDARPGTADVSGTGEKRPSRKRGPRSGESGNANVPRNAQPGDRSDLDNAGIHVQTPESVSANPPGTGSSNSPSHGIPNRGTDYLASPGSLIRQGSWKTAAETNLDIIQLVKQLETEGRLATPEEQKLLVKYTGWGASDLAQGIFGTFSKSGYEELRKRAQSLLTPEEWKTASRSTQYAHYTSEAIIRGMWQALQNFGFQHGRILEPGMGIGLFPVAAPNQMLSKSRYVGVEMDAMTARIARQLLQNQVVNEADYVKAKLPDNFFDVAIGNPPFADIRVADDPTYKKYGFNLHDYFFAKSIDKVGSSATGWSARMLEHGFCGGPAVRRAPVQGLNFSR